VRVSFSLSVYLYDSVGLFSGFIIIEIELASIEFELSLPQSTLVLAKIVPIELGGGAS